MPGAGARSGPLAASVRFAIRFRGVVIAVASLVLVYGVYDLSRARYDVFPEFAPPEVQIQTEAPGLAPEQTETLVTQPIETAIGGTPGVSSVRSRSIQGLSIVTVVFRPGTDVYRARQLVSERLREAASQLPPGVESPTMTPLTSGTSVALVLGLTSPTRSLMDLRTVAYWTIRRRLLAVRGVADVVIFGRDVPEYEIQVHPGALVRYGLGLNDVLAAARRASGVRGAGFIETRNQRIVLRTSGQAPTPAEIAGTVLRRLPSGATITLGSVADVAVAPEPPIGAAMVMGKPGVLLWVTEEYGANTLAVTGRLDAALRELRPALAREGVALDANVFRPTDFIHRALDDITQDLVIGAVLVIAVLLLFLFDLRAAAISSVAIPLSLLVATIVLRAFGVSLNTMTLGGLAIAIGEIVDDAVIDVENIIRRLRENRITGRLRPAWRVVFDASLEVRGAVVYATLAVAIVWIPVLALSGIAGRLFRPLGIAYLLAVLASLGVAVTLTPALSMLLFAGRREWSDTPPFTRWARRRYRRLLVGVERHPRSVGASLAVLVVLIVVTVPFLGGSFVPDLKEGHFIVHMALRPGTSLGASLRLGERVSRRLLSLPIVASVSQRVGRATRLGDDIDGPEKSEFEVNLKPLSGATAEGAKAEVRRALSVFPGASFQVNTFLGERMEESLSGFAAPVVVEVFGNDLDTLDREAADVADVLRDVRGAVDVTEQTPPGTPQLHIELNGSHLVRWGFTRGEVLADVETAYAGTPVGEIYRGDEAFPLAVRLDSAARADPTDVAALPLRSPTGTWVRLGQLATVRMTEGREQIQHLEGRRVQTVTADIQGASLTSFVRAARRRIAKDVRFAPGTYFEMTGAGAARQRAVRQLLFDSLLAAAGVLILLWVVVRNGPNVGLLLVDLPFALVGGLAAVFWMGGVLSLGAMVGFVTLFGITLRNSIMMMSHFEHLVSVEDRPWGPRTAIRGAEERLAPILMTSFVTGLALLPLALQREAPGNAIEGPMAVVILGGLMTSMALNLLVLPTLALRFGRFGTDSEAAFADPPGVPGRTPA